MIHDKYIIKKKMKGYWKDLYIIILLKTSDEIDYF